MPDHAITWDRSATGTLEARCTCGVLLRADSETDLGILVDEHALGAGMGERCRGCGGSLVPWTSSRGTIDPADGRCGPCLRDLLGERAYLEGSRP